MKKRIHIFGASGSGTTTIAKAVTKALDYTHFDTDSYFWEQTEEPFSLMRTPNDRIKLMNQDLKKSKNWILSGALNGWGDCFIPDFDLVIFVFVSPEERMKRLKKREFSRYGKEMLPGGNRYEKEVEFLEWAAKYDDENFDGRSFKNQKEWLEALPCPVLEVNNMDLEKSIKIVMEAITF